MKINNPKLEIIKVMFMP